MNKITVESPDNPQLTIDLSPLKVGKFTVTRRVAPGTCRIVYSTMDGTKVAGTQMSYPAPSDCQRHISRFREHARHSASTATAGTGSISGSLAERVTHLLQTASMTDSQLSSALACSAAIMSPILNKMVRSNQIKRKGKPGAYVYAAPIPLTAPSPAATPRAAVT